MGSQNYSISFFSSQLKLLLAAIAVFGMFLIVLRYSNHHSSCTTTYPTHKEAIYHRVADIQVNHQCESCKNTKVSANLEDCKQCERSRRLIFFVEVTNATSFISRYACAIESACHHNSDSEVIVYTLFDKNCTENNIMRVLCGLPNFRFIKLNVTETFMEVGMPNFERRITNKTSWRSAHLSDTLRLVMLIKHGGLYLDLDCIVLKPMRTLPFGIGFESSDRLANGIMKMPPGSKVSKAALAGINASYTGLKWTDSGPAAITAAYNKLCPGELKNHHPLCEGIHAFPPSYFYNIDYYSWSAFFDSNQIDYVEQKTRGHYISHFWNHLSKDLVIKPGVHQGISLLAYKNCPNIFPHLSD